MEKKEIAGRTLLSVPGYDEKIEFGVLVQFAYPVEGSGKCFDIVTVTDNVLFVFTCVQPLSVCR